MKRPLPHYFRSVPFPQAQMQGLYISREAVQLQGSDLKNGKMSPDRIRTGNKMPAVARILSHVDQMRFHHVNQSVFLFALHNRQSTLQDIICHSVRQDGTWSCCRHLLANWSFIIIPIGLIPSGLGVMISSIRAALFTGSAMTSAFSQTLLANLCRAMASIWPRSLDTRNVRSSIEPFSRTN